MDDIHISMKVESVASTYEYVSDGICKLMQGVSKEKLNNCLL